MEEWRKELIERLDRIRSDPALTLQEKFDRTVAEILAVTSEDDPK
jgi:hypothetical protein